jgi:cytosine/uracil/thiamine/allantoin permease
MRNAVVVLTAVLAGVVGVVGPAAAYVGPGAGLSLVGAFWGLLVAVGAALGFVIFWPLRRLFRRSRAKAAPATGETEADLRKDHTPETGIPSR